MNNYNNQGYMQMNPGLMDIDPMRYPDIYYMVYPFVVKKCDIMEKANSPTMYPYPSQEMIEKMTNEIYDECKDSYPKAIKEYENIDDNKVEQIPGRPRRRSLFRGLIGTLLIRELLRRRRRYPYGYYPRGYYPYGYGDYPYGYGDYPYGYGDYIY